MSHICVHRISQYRFIAGCQIDRLEACFIRIEIHTGKIGPIDTYESLELYTEKHMNDPTVFFRYGDTGYVSGSRPIDTKRLIIDKERTGMVLHPSLFSSYSWSVRYAGSSASDRRTQTCVNNVLITPNPYYFADFIISGTIL
jgi:hypothetical protein